MLETWNFTAIDMKIQFKSTNRALDLLTQGKYGLKL